MPKPKKILLADNRDDYRETTKEYLQLQGYAVAEVASPEACLQIIETDLPHVAILDYRLRYDDDEYDDSGLTLAQRLPERLPKILLTAYPKPEMARDALRVNDQGLPLVAGLVFKYEPLEVLHEYVKQTFDKEVRLNWDLQIVGLEQDALSLIRWLEPTLVAEQAAQRCEEWEDLLCRLFLEATRIELEQVLWQPAGQVAYRLP